MRRTRPPDPGDDETTEAGMLPGPIETGTDIGRIVVVDDEPANLRLLTRQLVRDGHAVLTATNGDEALDLIAREQPDLVLLDVVMPRRNGFETCRALKQSASTRLIPVVIVTALSEWSRRLRRLARRSSNWRRCSRHGPT